MRESIHSRIRRPENAKQILTDRLKGYAAGGAVHEDEEPKRVARKKGGKVPGEKSPERLDKPKRAAGGSIPLYHGSRADGHKLRETQVNVDREAAPRARGGRTKHRGGKTNIIIHAGGGDDGAKQQLAMEQGKKQGAMAVLSKLKGGAPGAPPAPMGGAPAAAPGPGAGGPPMGMAPPMAPPMRAKGGKVEKGTRPKLHQDDERIKVKGYSRRRGGACK